MDKVSRIGIWRIFNNGENQIKDILKNLENHFKKFPNSIGAYASHFAINIVGDFDKKWFSMLDVDIDAQSTTGDIKVELVSMIRKDYNKEKETRRFIVIEEVGLETKILPINYLKESRENHKVNLELYKDNFCNYIELNKNVIWNFHLIIVNLISILIEEMLLVRYSADSNFEQCTMEFISPATKRRVTLKVNTTVALKDFQFASKIMSNEINKIFTKLHEPGA